MNTKECRQGDLIFPILLIALGAVFLLNNFNYLPWDIWKEIWRLWPVLLIMWGVQLIFGRNRYLNWFLAVLALLLAATIILLAVGAENPRVNSWIKENLPFLDNLYFKR